LRSTASACFLNRAVLQHEFMLLKLARVRAELAAVAEAALGRFRYGTGRAGRACGGFTPVRRFS
jgi:hypothetical protein